MSVFEYHRPQSLEEALRLKAERSEAAFIAGGTDLMVQMREGRRAPAALISLRGVPDMSGVDQGPPARIGALTRVADLVESPLLSARYAAIVDGARSFGSVQIRNAATLGGNLCNASPAADLAPPLLVHGATVDVRSPKGERALPLEALVTGPGQTALAGDEVVGGVTLAEAPNGSGSAFVRKTRIAMDIALVSAAAWMRVEGGRCVEARLAAGAVAPTPVRLAGVEAALRDRPLDEDALAEVRRLAPEEVSPISDVRASADYRRHLVSVLAVRAIRRAFERSQR